MGEAKRRRQTENMSPTGISLSDFMLYLERYVGRVPCKSCTACCYHPKVNLVASDNAAKLDFEIREDGSLCLKRKADGSCVHLGPTGCTVYNDRPKACRMFDCRLYSALGIGIQFNADRGAVRKAPLWLFRRETISDAIWERAAEIAVAGCPEGSDADVVLEYLSKNLDLILAQTTNKIQATQVNRIAKHRKAVYG